MATLISLLISARQQRLIGIVMGAAIFAMLLVICTFVVAGEIRRTMISQGSVALDHFVTLSLNLDTTFNALRENVRATPCTPDFQRQLRRIAFLPDSFSEFLYAPGAVAQCSVSVARFDPPISLGKPDIEPGEGAPSSVWMDRGLSFIGLGGLSGSVVLRGPYAIVVPHQDLMMDSPAWLDLEVVIVGSDGRYWHRAGKAETYERYRIAKGPQGSAYDLALREILCDEAGRYCVSLETTPMEVVSSGWIYLVVALSGIAMVSVWLARKVKNAIVRHWSFESRFRRHLGKDTVVCAYQPIMDLHSGRIIGCEVLARWRDVDDTIVYPDRFIPLVEQYGLTAKFTRLVVQRAFDELSAAIPADRRLTLTFNIFPRDLDAAKLLEIFAVFRAASDRFDLVVELVESDQIVVADAQAAIETLKAAGIRTYIDDFGTGYSNIQNLAALSIDGVKLDRAFAMAPDGSLMAKMLGHAIEMIHLSGRVIVVEGVETAERLALLRALVPPIDYAQGYHIARPLDVRRFAEFLSRPVPASSTLFLAA